MALHHGTYLELPPQRRFAAASSTEKYLREQLSDPTLSDERRSRILSRAQKLGQWIAGTLEVIDPRTHNPDGSLRDDTDEGVDHEVEVSEGGASHKVKAPKKGASHEVEVSEEVVIEEG